MNKNQIRFYEIDFLRFVAAVAVVLFHYMFRGYTEGGYSPVSYAPLDQYAKYGYLGVHLFFMISGFVILLTAMKRNVVEFIISRIVRLYPAFWAGVTFTALMTLYFGGGVFTVSLPQYISNLSMIDGYLGVEPIDGVYWTLLVEIKFYALIFGILLIKKIRQIEWFLAGWLVISLVSVITPLPKLVQFILFPEWSSYFISGALFFLIKLKGINIRYISLLATSYALSLYFSSEEVGGLSDFYKTEFSAVIPMIIVSIFYLIFILVISNKLTFFRSTWVLKVGALTYPLYLVHQNVGFMLFTAFDGIVNKYILLALIFAFILLIAWMIHQLVEKNLSVLLKRWLEKVEFKTKAILN